MDPGATFVSCTEAEPEAEVKVGPVDDVVVAAMVIGFCVWLELQDGAAGSCN